MKILLKITLFCLLTLFSISSSIAQGGRGFQGTPEERAERQVTAMKDQLALSDAQSKRVKGVLLKYSTKMGEARAASEGDFTAVRETMRTLQKEQNEELKKYLTAEQFTNWEKIQVERRQKRRNRPPNGERNGKKKMEKTKTKATY